MREMEEQPYRAELGKRRDCQDGHDRQHGTKLGALAFAWNENPHGPLHRGSSLKSQFGKPMSEPDVGDRA